MFLPVSSEQAELVEVFRLDNGTDEGRLVAIWEAGDTRDALALVASLPAEDFKRCFFPGWRIQVHSDTAVLFGISFCFRCDGALLRGPTVPAEQDRIHGFDSESAESQKLLARFRATDHG